MVFDVSKYRHPGGKRILEKYAGQDVTERFKTIHSKITVRKLRDGGIPDVTVVTSAPSPVPAAAQAVHLGIVLENHLYREHVFLMRVSCPPEFLRIFCPGHHLIIKAGSLYRYYTPLSYTDNAFAFIYKVYSGRGLGDMTQCLANLKPGAQLELSGPFGDLYYSAGRLILHQNSIRPNPLIMIAGGTGIVSFVPILMRFLRDYPQPQVRLLASFHTPGDVLLHFELDELQSRYANFRYHFIISGTDGRINSQMLSGFVNTSMKMALYLLSGSTEFERQIETYLQELGAGNAIFSSSKAALG